MLFAASSLGEHRRFEIAPFVKLPTDEIATNGKKVWLIRAGVIVETREVSGDGVLVLPEPHETPITISSVIFFRSRPMPGQVATIIGVVQDPGGTLRFQFSDGEREYPPTEDQTGAQRALLAVQYLDTEINTAKDMAILKALRNSPDGTNLGASIGLSAAVDFTANQEVIISV